MCFFCNEEHRGRTNRWKEQYQEEFGITPDDLDYKILSTFSIIYDEFMDYCYPNLSKQLTLFSKFFTANAKQGLVSNGKLYKGLSGSLGSSMKLLRHEGSIVIYE